MKKLTHIIAALAIVSFAASCQKETEQAPDATQNSGKIVFTATMDDTKAIIDGNMPKWENGDKIAIRAFSSNSSMATIPSGRVAGPSVTQLTSTGLETGGSSSVDFIFNASGTTKDKIDAADFYIAWLLPDPSNTNSYSPQAMYSDKSSITTEADKANGYWVYDGWCSDGYLAQTAQTFGRVQARVAYSSNRNLTFKNIYHLIKFTPNCAGASYAVLSSLDGTTNICDSRVRVYFNSDTDDVSSVVAQGGLPKTSIYLDITNYGGDGTNYYFALIPGYTIPGFKIELKNASDETLQTFTYPNTLTTVRNKITTISNFDDRVEEAQKAVLLNGEQFNIALKTLAGDSDPTKYTNNTSITSIVADTRSSVTTGSLVSASTSAVPVYANISGGVVTLSTPSNKIYFPADASYSFSDLKGLKTINADKLVTADVTNATYMFYYCEELVTLNMTFNANNILNTQDMFDHCKKLNSVDISGLAGNLQRVSFMFDYCQALTEIRFSEAFNTAAVAGYTRMFEGCSSLNQLYIKGFHLTKSVIGGSTTAIYDLFKDVLKDVPSTCTIHYTPHDDATEYDVRFYLPYKSSGTEMGDFIWTTDN